MDETIRACPQCQNRTYEIKFTEGAFLVVQCNRCSLVYLGNPPDEKTLYEDYHAAASMNPSEYTAASMNTELRDMHAINTQRINTISRQKSSGKLLDIGCGRGYFLKTAAEHGYNILGIDISETAVKGANEKMNVPATCESLEDLRKANQKFDIITLWHVLEHFLNPFAVLKQIYSLLNDTGFCFIEVPNLRSLKFIISKDKWQGGNHPKYHRTFFTNRTLRQALVRTGFSTVRRIPLSYALPGRSPGYEMLKKGLNRLAMDTFLDFVAIKQTSDDKREKRKHVVPGGRQSIF